MNRIDHLVQKNVKHEAGSGLVTVIITLAVVAILTVSLSLMVGSNLSMAKHQEGSVEAYYYAETGIDIALAALLQKGEADPETDCLYYQDYGPVYSDLPISASNPLKTIPATNKTASIQIPNASNPKGEAAITVFAKDVGSERWIHVESVGRSTGSTLSRTTYARFKLTNPAVILREKDPS